MLIVGKQLEPGPERVMLGARRIGMRIRISNQGEPSRIESFDHKTDVKIGRVASNDLILAERGISSNHARLDLDSGGQLFITDVGSTNGTFVNGQRISGSQVITLNDEVYVCHIKIEVAHDNQEFPPEAALAPVQTGSTQMASPDQVEALRRARGAGSLSGEIGGNSGVDAGEWNQAGGQQQGYDQSQWNHQQGNQQGQWNQAGHDPGTWNGQGGQANGGTPSNGAQPGQGQWNANQGGAAQPGYDQGQWGGQAASPGAGQPSYDQGQWNANQANQASPNPGIQANPGEWNQAARVQPGHAHELIEEIEEIDELDAVQEFEPDPEPEPEPQPEPARRAKPPRPTGGPGFVEAVTRPGHGGGFEAGPPSFDAGPPSFEAAPPSFEAAPPSFEAAPPSFEAAPPSFEAAPPSLAAGPPSVGAGPPSVDAGPPSFDAGPPSFDAGPPSFDAGPPSVDAGPPKLDAGPPSVDAGPPGVDAAPPSFMAGPASQEPNVAPPPKLDGPPQFDGPPNLGGPPALTSPPQYEAIAPVSEAPAQAPQPEPAPAPVATPSPAPVATPAPAPVATLAATPMPPVRPTVRARPLIEPEQQFDLRPEFAARGNVYFELLSDLGASVDYPPEDGEKQRKAARVGAKRRLAVFARNDPDLMFDDLGSEADRLLAELFELGPLTDVVDDPAVREIVIRDPTRIYVDRGRGRERLDGGFSCSASLAVILRRFVGEPLRWDPSSPWLDHRMSDGTRLRGADASVAPMGPVVVITRPAVASRGGLSQVASISDPVAEYLRAALQARASVLLCLGEGCDGTQLVSACAHELANVDPGHLAIVRAGAQVAVPNGAMVFDAEPGLTATPIRLAIDTGSTGLIVHRAGGAGLASAWAGLGRGLEQMVVSIAADDPKAALEICAEGLLLGGYGLDRESLRRHVAASINVVVALGQNSRGEEIPTAVAEFDGHGSVVLLASRATPDDPWQHHQAPVFVAEMARRGVPFDPTRLASLGQPRP